MRGSLFEHCGDGRVVNECFPGIQVFWELNVGAILRVFGRSVGLH